MNSEENNKIGSIKKGILIGFISNLLFLVFYFNYVSDILYSNKNMDTKWLLIFLKQLIFIICPIAIYFIKEKETLKGILFTSGITFLLWLCICGAMLSPNMFK